jgi:hypothetical protein
MIALSSSPLTPLAVVQGMRLEFILNADAPPPPPYRPRSGGAFAPVVIDVDAEPGAPCAVYIPPLRLTHKRGRPDIEFEARFLKEREFFRERDPELFLARERLAMSDPHLFREREWVAIRECKARLAAAGF